MLISLKTQSSGKLHLVFSVFFKLAKVLNLIQHRDTEMLQVSAEGRPVRSELKGNMLI